MTDIKLLPLPEDAVEWLRQYGVANTAFQMEVIEGWFQAHARAVAEHNVAARDAEIEALRAEVERLGADSRMQAHMMELVQARAERAEARAERRAEALREALECGEDGDWQSARQYITAALRDHDQEVGNG